MRTFATTVLLVCALGSVVTACGTAPADKQAACDQAFSQAMAIEPGADTVSAVDGAIAGCPSLETWVAAAARYPDAFDGQDPTALANERCGSVQLANTAVCLDLRGR